MKPKASWSQVFPYLILIFVGFLVVTLMEGGFSCPGILTPPQNQVQYEQGNTNAGSDSASQPVSSSSVTLVGLGEISVSDLPPEGRTTLELIKQGGPFPFSKDDTVFNNYEGLLPEKPAGYYHEYTVITPGSSDRGARRIVAGRNGEYYYTSDHYRSFKLIKE